MNKFSFTPFVLALMVLSFTLQTRAQEPNQEQLFLDGVSTYVSKSCTELIITRSWNYDESKPSDKIFVDCDNNNLFKAVLYSSTKNDLVYFKVSVLDPDLYEFVKFEPVQGYEFDRKAFNSDKLIEAIDKTSLTLNVEKTQQRKSKSSSSEYRLYENIKK